MCQILSKSEGVKNILAFSWLISYGMTRKQTVTAWLKPHCADYSWGRVILSGYANCDRRAERELYRTLSLAAWDSSKCRRQALPQQPFRARNSFGVRKLWPRDWNLIAWIILETVKSGYFLGIIRYGPMGPCHWNLMGPFCKKWVNFFQL